MTAKEMFENVKGNFWGADYWCKQLHDRIKIQYGLFFEDGLDSVITFDLDEKTTKIKFINNDSDFILNKDNLDRLAFSFKEATLKQWEELGWL